MNIKQAAELMKLRKKVRRDSWDYTVIRIYRSARLGECIQVEQLDTASGRGIVTAWIPSLADLLADDYGEAI